jgi:hypothetical protein
VTVKIIRIVKHELSRSKCGSFEVRFSDGRPGVFFYWDDIAGRPLREAQLTREEALEQARAYARAMRDGP